jgi:hypothetical protein
VDGITMPHLQQAGTLAEIILIFMNIEKTLVFFAFFFTTKTLVGQIGAASNQGNSVIQLDTIKDFRIKIDGGCAFYSKYDSTNQYQPYIFVISANKRAFFSIKGQHDYIYLKRVSVTKGNNNLLKEIFKGSGYIAILKTRNIEEIISSKKRQIGTLDLTNKSDSISITIKGYANW